MGGAVERVRAFGDEQHGIEDRHEIDVGEGELIINRIAGPGDRPVENADLLAQRRPNRSIACRPGLPSTVFGAAYARR
jgi:hypothetical protein